MFDRHSIAAFLLAVFLTGVSGPPANAAPTLDFFPDPAFDSGWQEISYGWTDIPHFLGDDVRDAVIEVRYLAYGGYGYEEIVTPDESGYRANRHAIEVTASGDVDAVRVRMWRVDFWATGTDDLPPAHALPRLQAQSPSRGAGTIRCELPVESAVSLAAYDVRGALVQQLLGPTTLSKGVHEVGYEWPQVAGVYFLQLIAAEEIVTKKLVVVP